MKFICRKRASENHLPVLNASEKSLLADCRKSWPALIGASIVCGKILLAMKFAIRGATGFNEHRVLRPFGETGEKLTTNAASPGFSLDDLASDKMILLGYN